MSGLLSPRYSYTISHEVPTAAVGNVWLKNYVLFPVEPTKITHY